MADISEMKNLRDAAAGKIPCDLLIKNANVLDVFSRSFYKGDVAIYNGKIAALGEREAKEVIDAKGRYLSPGLIDSHIHIESTLITPDTLNDVILPKGVTAIIADPHEIANVCGTQGIDYMLAASEGLDLDVHINLPSCVPSTPLEHAGADLKAKDLKPYYGKKGVLALAEVMDSPAVEHSDDMLQKLYDALSSGTVIDGHGATLDLRGLDLYSALKIRSDHECIDLDGFNERIRRGIYVQVRQGTVTKNLEALLPGINASNAHRVCFCTDDKHVDDLMENGGLDFVVRSAIKLGLDPALALSIGSFSAATLYKLENKGAVCPGYDADLVLWNDLNDLKADLVIKGGKKVAEEGKIISPKKGFVPPKALTDTVNYAPITKKDLELKLEGEKKLHTIRVVPGNVVTEHEIIQAEGDVFVADAAKDLSKLAVIERHHATGNCAVAAVTGFKLKKGAIATTVAHDSHNIIVIGMSDEDMLLAIDELKKINGGYVVVADGKVLSSVRLEVAGLITAQQPEQLIKDLEKLHSDANSILETAFNPFQMLSFISLPVIPFLKLTDIGLIDVMKFAPIPACE